MVVALEDNCSETWIFYILYTALTFPSIPRPFPSEACYTFRKKKALYCTFQVKNCHLGGMHFVPLI